TPPPGASRGSPRDVFLYRVARLAWGEGQENEASTLRNPGEFGQQKPRPNPQSARAPAFSTAGRAVFRKRELLLMAERISRWLAATRSSPSASPRVSSPGPVGSQPPLPRLR